MEDGSTTESVEELARRLADRVRRDYGEAAKIDRLVLVASVTEENGVQRAVVEAAGNLPLYAQAGTLRPCLSTLPSGATTKQAMSQGGPHQLLYTRFQGRTGQPHASLAL